MTTLLNDLRYAFRTLIKARAFTAVAVLTLALAIGANTAMFGALNALVLRPLPFYQPDRLAMIWENNPKLEGLLAERVPTCLRNYLDWRSQSRSFEDMAAMFDVNLNLTGVDKPEQVETAKVSDNFFKVMGVGAGTGRTFAPGEGEPGKNRVAILTLSFFEKRFGSGSNLNGKAVMLNGVTYTVIGVLPRQFHLGAVWGGLDSKKPVIFLPLNTSPDQPKDSLNDRNLLIYGRLKAGVDVEQARAEMKLLGKRLEEKDPTLNSGFGISVFPLRVEDVSGDTRSGLLILQAAVGFVLLIACANLANLLLARAARREKEIAIRVALGATSARIVRQVLTESMALSLIGGALGLLLAHWGIAAINRFAPEDLLGTHVLQFDARVFSFTLLTVVIAGLLFGLAPCVHALRQEINSSLTKTSKAVIGGSSRPRSALVVVEVTLAVVLLVGAGLTVHSLYALRHVSPGFEPDHLLTAQIRLPEERYSKPEQVAAFCNQLLERVKALPGVKSAALASGLPMQDISATGFRIEGQPLPSQNDYLIANLRQVSEDYFSTLGTSMLRGRSFTRQEAESDKPGVVVINESMAKRFWPGQDAIGKAILRGGQQSPEKRNVIIGIVADSHQLGLDNTPQAEMYLPQRRLTRISLAIRTNGDPMSLADSVTRQVLAIDKDQPVAEIQSMQKIVDDTMGGERFGTLLMFTFAVLALLLASVGLYGVLAYLVSQRTQEIGIRLALGAQRGSVLRMVAQQGIFLAGVGLLIGLAGAFILARVLSGLLYGIKPFDPITFITSAGSLLLISVIASYIPARRATRVDPMVALRYE